jgi:hypothetical protein
LSPGFSGKRHQRAAACPTRPEYGYAGTALSTAITRSSMGKNHLFQQNQG